MQNPLIIISLALATGVVIGIFVQSGSDIPDATKPASSLNSVNVAADQKAIVIPGADHSTADITELNRLLQKEISARQVLEQKVETLSRQMADIGSDSQPTESTTLSEQEDDDDLADEPVSNQDWFNEQALINSGIDSSQARELKIYFEQLEMQRLFLRDQSIRENWNSEKLRGEMQALQSQEDELKNQLSEDAYDAYLYASGRPNRVAVTSVLENAQAGIAGIVSGDHIIRYDNQRIYNWRDLQQATASGSISDTVALEVEREGKSMQFYLTRGPLGIRMNSLNIAP